MDLNALTVFVRVVEAGSFVGAARVSQIPKSTIARRIDELEASLGVRLLERSTRQLRPTEAGLSFYERCRQIVEDIEDATATVSSRQQEPQGRLRCTTSVLMAETYMGKWCVEYLERYPKVELDLYLANRRVDLVAEGFDLAIRIGELEPSSTIVRRMLPAPLFICASPDYLREYGSPTTPQDLSDHACVVFSPERAKQSWALRNEAGDTVSVSVAGRMVVNSLAVAFDACVAGFGIARVPSFLCSEALERHDVVHLLPQWCSTSKYVHALYPSRKHLSPTVRTFVDFMTEKLAASPWA